MAIFNGTVENIENNKNKVFVIDENSTDEQYPSAKAVYVLVGDIEASLDSVIDIQNKLIGGDGE